MPGHAGCYRPTRAYLTSVASLRLAKTVSLRVRRHRLGAAVTTTRGVTHREAAPYHVDGGTDARQHLLSGQLDAFLAKPSPAPATQGLRVSWPPTQAVLGALFRVLPRSHAAHVFSAVALGRRRREARPTVFASRPARGPSSSDRTHIRPCSRELR